MHERRKRDFSFFAAQQSHLVIAIGKQVKIVTVGRETKKIYLSVFNGKYLLLTAGFHLPQHQAPVFTVFARHVSEIFTVGRDGERADLSGYRQLFDRRIFEYRVE